MNHDRNTDLDQHARACWRAAETHLSTRTVAALHRRRISTCTAGTGGASRLARWPLAAAMSGACALVIAVLLWLPPPQPADDVPESSATAALDALDALEAINLTALDEDSDFFLWLSAHETSLLAME